MFPLRVQTSPNPTEDTHRRKSISPRTAPNNSKCVLYGEAQNKMEVSCGLENSECFSLRVHQSEIRRSNINRPEDSRRCMDVVYRSNVCVLPRSSLNLSRKTLLYPLQRQSLSLDSVTYGPLPISQNLHRNHCTNHEQTEIIRCRDIFLHRRFLGVVNFDSESSKGYSIDSPRIRKSGIYHQLPKITTSTNSKNTPLGPLYRLNPPSIQHSGGEDHRHYQSSSNISIKELGQKHNHSETHWKADIHNISLFDRKKIRLAPDKRSPYDGRPGFVRLEWPNISFPTDKRSTQNTPQNTSEMQFSLFSQPEADMASRDRCITQRMGSCIPMELREDVQDASVRLWSLDQRGSSFIDNRQFGISSNPKFLGNHSIPMRSTYQGRDKDSANNLRQPKRSLLLVEGRQDPSPSEPILQNLPILSNQLNCSSPSSMDSYSNQHCPRLAVAPTTITQSELAKIQRDSLAPSSNYRYEREFSNYLEWTSQNYPNQAPHEDLIILYLASLDKTAKGAIANQILNIIKHSMKRDPTLYAHIDFKMPLLKMTAQGIMRRNPNLNPKPPRHPLTWTQLSQIAALPFYKTQCRDIALLAIGLYGCLRAAEISSLKRSDLNLLEDGSFTLTFRRLKKPPGTPLTTITIRNTTFLGFNITNHISKYVDSFTSFDSYQSPLFPGYNKKPLSSEGISALLIRCLKKLNSSMSTKHYSSHSIRIGGATFCAARGLSISEIMAFGGWKSDSFILYIRDIERFPSSSTTSTST